ncbi:hypothetical protein GYMLUDRAFT_562989 [Collybiopsis luxurians FD-317 M1]|uniref:F-box domain-containing protein n=1 Tax=Collybiopsis luxurians FD-317 M1 TaxID=944289 RepID=A0A0D0CS42_9AGAR|nr:hypothetical protein GYMLUDRAFT_562989 [Collybiopsis luxurians FD-317 M1]
MAPIESFSKAAQHIISGVDALAQKIVVHDDGPILEQLRQRDCTEVPSLLDPFLQDAIPRLFEYDHRIALLEGAFQKLKDARDGFKRSVDLRRSLISPVRRLPEDILVEIFLLYIQDCGTVQGEERRTYFLTLSEERRVFSPNFTLSSVCSLWRRVVFSRPTFWSSFALDLGLLGAYEGKSKITAVLSECLSRSANARLSLYMEFDDSDWEDVLDLFLKQASRWEHLDFIFCDSMS